MEIMKENIASINNNNPDLDRVQLSIAKEIVDGDDSYFIITDTNEDCGPHFDSIEEAEQAVHDMWGRSSEWDLQFK